MAGERIDWFLISGSVFGSPLAFAAAFYARYVRRAPKRSSLKVVREDGSIIKIWNLDRSEVEEIVGRFRDRVQSSTK